jgi:integrase
MTIPTKEVRSASGRTYGSCGEPSFADALAKIRAATGLSPSRRTHWATSLRAMARHLGRPPEAIPARIAAISDAVRKLPPEQSEAKAKTRANHRANARSALLWYNVQTRGTGRAAPMASCYRHLLALIDDRHLRDLLSPFFRFLMGVDVAPNEVTDRHVEAYVVFKHDTGFAKFKMSNIRRLVRGWNECSARVPEWPQRQLIEPSSARPSAGPAWEHFLPGLRSDIEAYCSRIARRRKSSSGRPLWPCSPSTIAMRRRQLVAAVRAAVKAGIPLDDLPSLRAVCRPDRVEAVIEHYWTRSGAVPGIYVIDLAGRFLGIAREEGLPPDEVDRLDEIRVVLEEYRPTGLTEKNRALIRQVIQGDVWKKVVALPGRMMGQARSRTQSSPARAAVMAQLAVAIRLLVMAPVRIQNLASTTIGFNLIRPGGPGSEYLLVFPDYDVKNRVPLEFPLDPATTAMIDEYIAFHRPTLLRGFDHQFLFPGEGNNRKLTRGLGEQISERLHRELGVKITPHQFRHAAAAIILKHQPGNYELVRRVLGHRNIQTTIDFYIGLETLEATRMFGRMILGETASVSANGSSSGRMASSHA